MPRRGASAATLSMGAVVAALLALVSVYPMLRLLEAALRSSAGEWTVAFVRAALATPGLVEAGRNSLVVAVVSTLLATPLGAVLAWLVARTDVPGRRVLRWALLVPFVVPSYIGAIAWVQLLGGAGWLNQLAARTLWNVRGADGVVFVMILTVYPFAYVTVLGALDRLDPSLEESARIAGAPLRRIVRDVTLPMMRPAVASGAALVFVDALSNFGVPAVLGFSDGFFVLTTKIYDLIGRSAQPGSLNQAAALSLVLAAGALAALAIQRSALQRVDARLPQRAAPDAPLSLGRARLAAAVSAWTVVGVAGVAPVVAILLGSLTRALGRPPLPGNLTLDHLHETLAGDAAALRAVRNSLVLALVAGLVVVLAGAVIGYLATRTRLPGRVALDAAATLPYALPGTVVGAAVLLAFLRPVAGVALFNTLWIILVAYLANNLAYGVRAASGALAMVDPHLEEASRVSGASQTTTLRRIVVPVVRPALFGGFFLVFVPTLGELSTSALLWSPGNETVGVLVFNRQSAGDTQGAAAVAVILVVTVAVANLVTRRLSGGRVGY
ncbi:MAG: ABC transporter permease [Egibacteraceae bacterium]